MRAIARFKLGHRPFDVMFDGRDFQIRRGFGSAFRENVLRACLTVWLFRIFGVNPATAVHDHDSAAV